MEYQSIENYAVIGNMRTLALVGKGGSIDFFCFPEFDSPTVFAALLDPGKGGYFCIRPRLKGENTKQFYFPNTNVLLTRFLSDDGIAETTDAMPVVSERGPGQIIRKVKAIHGEIEFQMECLPRFDYAQEEHTTRFFEDKKTVIFQPKKGTCESIRLQSTISLEIRDGGASARFKLKPGEVAYFIFGSHDAEHEEEVVDVAQVEEALKTTIDYWREWISHSQYKGRWREIVDRSALLLKLLTSQQYGSIVAAPTFGLPELIGGERNWDYRYTWLRDSTFVLYALDKVGFDAEAEKFFAFLKRVCRREDGGPLRIMYAVDGARELPETELSHLEGYRCIGPVRVGNGAAGQFQLDVYGEVLGTAAQWAGRRRVSEGLWQTLRGLVEWTAGHWREPDLSIWEPRQAPRHHVYSKVMAWVALERGADIAKRLGHDEEAARWRAEADAVHGDVMTHGWDRERRTFVQVYGEPQLDAALLVIPKVRFLPTGDPRVRSTLAALRRDLATPREELLYRYRTGDGLEGEEGAFLFTSFWMVQNLAMTGEMDEAERLYAELLRHGGSLGLLAEEVDPATLEQAGNFPQALSHAAVINTAVILERLRRRASAASAAPR